MLLCSVCLSNVRGQVFSRQCRLAYCIIDAALVDQIDECQFDDSLSLFFALFLDLPIPHVSRVEDPVVAGFNLHFRRPPVWRVPFQPTTVGVGDDYADAELMRNTASWEKAAARL
ncbi:hypothetical protein T08_15076 [Trichinella sp. T8]|nr:hypothetical protein T08_15076 [Trichinella sp. T8]